MKKLLSLVIAVLLVIGLLPVTAMADGVTYYKWDDSQKKLVSDVKGNANSIDSQIAALQDDYWYYVNETVTIDNLVELNGIAHIILGTNANITFNKGIKGNGGQKLNIYGVNADGTGGTLIAKGSAGTYADKYGQPGINVSCFNMHGGTVTVTGGKGANGSGTNGETGGSGIAISMEFNMYGGKVTATGGSGGDYTDINYSGGDGGTGISVEVDAPFKMYGGAVTATGGNGGSGYNYEECKGGNGGVGISSIEMYGGTVNTNGGNGGSGDYGGNGGVGISSIEMYGGTVNTNGGNGGTGNCRGGNGGFGLGALSMTGGEIVVKGGQGGTGGQIPGNDSAAIHNDCIPNLGEGPVEMNGTNSIPKGFVIKTDTENVDGSAATAWEPNGTALNDEYKYVEILFDEDEEDDTPDEVRRSYTTITIGGNKDKAETKAEEVKEEENPDTGAPIMNLGAIAVVLGAAYVISKKH